MAIPNLRGGGEYGQRWHEAGMRAQKQNVFDDFIAAAEYLETEGYTSRDRLAIAGGSNGGLLVSAVVTQRPELYKAVLCQVPLTDMLRYHHFGLANIWSEEYGSSDDPEMFKAIHQYSPVHNATKGVDYPAILVTGSENDARTDPVHARKFMAAVRWADSDHGTEEPIMLHIQSDSGHG
ncbi:MAG: prolyl oligopeptidase family serine peptidase, partial [Myxococcota bacterium]|nr:prolyl oligopeptidase family serine peptidase [Myxococcota bacterium]